MLTFTTFTTYQMAIKILINILIFELNNSPLTS